MKNTSENTKAKKTTINLGSIPLNVYQMPDGSYKLSLDSVTEAIVEQRRNLLRFMNGKSELALPFKDYQLFHADRVSIDGPEQFFKPIPVKLATAYWLYRAMKGNQKAAALMLACTEESIERRADKAFDFQRTEEEYNRVLSDRYHQYEQILSDRNQEIDHRRLPGDDLYLPIGIN